MRKIRAGFVGFGEVNTPREVIERKCAAARQRLAGLDIELAGTDPVSDDPEGRQADRAVRELKAGGDFDLLVVCVAGWIPSWAVLRVTDEFRHLPILLWGLTGWMEGGRLVTTADQAGTSALRKVFEDMGYRFRYVYEVFGTPPKDAAILEFAAAARAAALLRRSKIGMMGYRDMNLYGTMFDGASLKRVLGVEIEFFEMLEIAQRIEKLAAREVEATVERVLRDWSFEKPAQRATVEKGTRWYLALRDRARERGYEAVSLIDVDGMKKLAGFPPAMVFMLLADDPGVCTVPENDSLGAVTQLMVRHLTGQLGLYLEFYEFFEDRLLMGVPDFVPAEAVDGRVRVTPTAFGGFGEGILNVSRLKTGPRHPGPAHLLRGPLRPAPGRRRGGAAALLGGVRVEAAGAPAARPGGGPGHPRGGVRPEGALPALHRGLRRAGRAAAGARPPLGRRPPVRRDRP